ncbi:MAG: endonuclease III [Selenomonadaceae bacterium]|nr:endonuclease III [Selenomonadaceae bacterium]
MTPENFLSVEVVSGIITEVFDSHDEKFSPEEITAVTEKILTDIKLNILEETYRGAVPQLKFGSPFELLVAVILSAQCTDKRVNEVTKILFPVANTPEKILSMCKTKLEEIIKPCGFYHAKAEHIIGAAKMLVDEYGGEVPKDFDALIKLPGVGRKTANVVTSVAFNAPAIAVDTHVFRLANRMKLAEGKTPLEVELGLQKVIPREKWSAAHHWLIWHGRGVCKARKPQCDSCPLFRVCPSSNR